jgi:hypothetical protein
MCPFLSADALLDRDDAKPLWSSVNTNRGPASRPFAAPNPRPLLIPAVSLAYVDQKDAFQ